MVPSNPFVPAQLLKIELFWPYLRDLESHVSPQNSAVQITPILEVKINLLKLIKV